MGGGAGGPRAGPIRHMPCNGGKHGLGAFLYSMRNLKGLIMPDPQCGSVVFASDLLAFKIFQFSHLFKLQRKRINKAMASSSHG